MTHSFNTNTKNNDEWLTPPHIIKALGEFDLDPCAPIVRPWPMASRHYTKEDDGLVQDWIGRVWCNPPYGAHTFTWMNKLAAHGNGIALIFCRTETKGFQAEILGKADAIFFIQGRLTFYTVDGRPARNKKGRLSGANAPSCLVAYGQNNVYALADSGLKGRLVMLK